MEWLATIRRAISFMEDHLLDDISAQDVADETNMSSFFLQRGFSAITGYGIAEYLRNRRLYEAAKELKETDDKIIDIALKYGYETPESFSKAFSRFHGGTPMQIRNHQMPVKAFLPLSVKIVVHGGWQMEYKVKNMFGFTVIGFQKVFTSEEAYQKIPEFWDEMIEKYAKNVYEGNTPSNPYEQAIVDNGIGEYGICIDDLGEGKFRYMIAGKYTGGEIPEGMVTYTLPNNEWAVFDCYGPIPKTLQSMNTRIFKEWLPGNPDYELSGNVNVEWYDCIHGTAKDPDYHSAIWVPVKRK